MIASNDILAFSEIPRILARADGFVYLLPHPALRSWISNYSITFPNECQMSPKYAVIPHGCATLVFSGSGNRFVSYLFGPATKPACVGGEVNRYQMIFIVEFQPGGYYAFSGMPQNELTDRVIPFDIVSPALNSLMVQRMEAAADILTLIAEIDMLFLAHHKTAFYREEFYGANKMIVSSGGLISVKELSQNVHYSGRHLGRLFREYMGVNVKSFARLVRVNKAIRLLQKPRYSLTQAYLQTGYYDMPHFIHDFKSICGVTPQEYRDNLSDYYSEIAKF